MSAHKSFKTRKFRFAKNTSNAKKERQGQAASDAKLQQQRAAQQAARDKGY